MRRNKNKTFRQVVILLFSAAAFVIAFLMIFAAATIFRTQIPFFQLVDGGIASPAEMVGPAPAPYPGVIDLDVPPTTQLFLILGSDFRPQAGFRTDVVMLAAVDTLSGRISLVSFPRDLWVTIPGYYEQRINTVMQIGGISLLANTLQTNFGVYPTDYAMVDMAGFLEVIDALGGIEVETDIVTADACDSSLDPDRWCEVGPGTVELDSDYALWYARARYNSSDFDRLRRTQEVVQAVIAKVASPMGVFKLPALMSVYDQNVQSNITPDQMLLLARAGLGFNSDKVHRYTIGPNEVTSWVTADGAAVLLPNTAAIQAILHAAINFQ
ncbi:MAG: LCP family protein [Chloroflexota bacterium]|nr:LCP family protein [Chloroflexota bacterium]